MREIPEDALIDIVRRAGAAILDVYDSDFAVESKADTSPLTQADLASHEIIVAGLEQLTPLLPIVSEEATPAGFAERAGWAQYWLVDPLDGTKEFVNRNGEFTVNIALIENHAPRYGIVGVPVQDLVYTGDVAAGDARVLSADGTTKTLQGRAMSGTQATLDVVASRSHGGERLEGYLDALEARVAGLKRKPVGSSLKLCVLAAGEADCYPRLGPTSEWDIAAAHAVLAAAGGGVYTFDGASLPYNTKESFLNPEFVAVADAGYDWFSLLPAVPDADE